MKGLCPSCSKESVLSRIHRVKDFDVKGESIPVEADYFVCLECGVEFDNPDPAHDPLAEAYREYRRRKGMVQPAEIREFRKTYGLSQRELAGLLGFGGATLSRYENGSLQDDAHDRLLRLIRLPENLLKIVEEDTGVLAADRRTELSARLRTEVNRSELIRLIDRKGSYSTPNPFNGQKELDIRRLLIAVKILCYHKNVYKTKLNKLLFYADFLHFKEHGQGITGLCYAHLPYGPAPDHYEVILQRLTDIDATLIVDEDPSMDYGGEYFHTEIEPDRSVLSFSELQALIQVDAFFKNYSSRDIKFFSLEEEGYRRTENGELISYEYAPRLRI